MGVPARKTLKPRKRRSKALSDHFYKRWLQALVVLEVCPAVCLVGCLVARAVCLVGCLVVSQEQEVCLADLGVLHLLVVRPLPLVLIWTMVPTSRKSINNIYISIVLNLLI